MKSYKITALNAEGAYVSKIVFAKTKAEAIKMVSPMIFKFRVKAKLVKSLYRVEYYKNWDSKRSACLTFTVAAHTVLEVKRKMAATVNIKNYSLKFVDFSGIYHTEGLYENFIQLD